MKKKLILAFGIVLCVMMLSVNAYALTEGDWEFQLQDNEAVITKYTGDGGVVVMPSQLMGAVVTKIDGTYLLGDDVTCLTIPASVKEIGSYSLGLSRNLEKVILSEGLEKIGRRAFLGCRKLTEINLPSTLRIIEDYAFQECGITEAAFYPGLEKIGDYAFWRSGLLSVDLSNTNPTIGSNIFQESDNLKTVNYGSTATEIPHNAFYGCEALENVSLPSTITKIQSWAFHGCKSLKHIIIPTSVKEIRDFAFNSTGLVEVVVPYGVEKLGTAVFGDTSSLKGVYVPDSVTKINSGNYGIISGSKNAIVYCNSGSAIEADCKKKTVSYLTDKSVNSEITVLYNGTRISFHTYDQDPVIVDGRTLVPMRSIFEAMLATVQWDGSTSTAIADRNGTVVKIKIGDNKMYKDGKEISIDVPAQLMNGRTMIPVRVIAEAFGADVRWNGAGRTAIITE